MERRITADDKATLSTWRHARQRLRRRRFLAAVILLLGCLVALAPVVIQGLVLTGGVSAEAMWVSLPSLAVLLICSMIGARLLT